MCTSRLLHNPESSIFAGVYYKTVNFHKVVIMSHSDVFKMVASNWKTRELSKQLQLEYAMFWFQLQTLNASA